MDSKAMPPSYVAGAPDDKKQQHLEFSPAKPLHWWTRTFRRDRWSTEIAALVLSTLIVAVIVAVLHQMNGRAVDAWTAPITLNALLSLLVTILYFPLTSVVTNCIYQLQWIYFDTARQLSEFEVLNRSGRGVTGALPILFSRSPRLPFRFTALLMLAIAAIGPFTQQILGIDSALLVTATNASVPTGTMLNKLPAMEGSIGHMYTAGDATDPSTLTPYPAFNDALNAGVFASAVTNFTVTPSCKGDSCVWTDYPTFMVRSQVTNVTDRIVFANNSAIKTWLDTAAFNESNYANLSTVVFGVPQIAIISVPPANKTSSSASTDALFPSPPDGITSAMLEEAIGQTTAGGTIFTGFFTNATTPTTQFNSESVIYYLDIAPLPQRDIPPGYVAPHQVVLQATVYFLNIGINATYTKSSWQNIVVAYRTAEAWQVTFDLVLQKFSARQANGTFSEMASGAAVLYDGPGCTVFPNSTTSTCMLNYTMDGTQYALNSSIPDALYSSMSGKLSSVVIEGRASFLQAANGGLPFGQDADPTSTSDAGSAIFQVVVDQLAGKAPVVLRPDAYGSDHDVVLGVKSDSNFTLDDLMGNVARSLTHWVRTSQAQSAPGDVYGRFVVYSVEWRWISVPVILIVLVACLLVYTAWEAHQKDVPIWTDNSLVTLVHGVDEYTRADLAGIRSTEELTRACEGIRVRLRRKDYILDAVN